MLLDLCWILALRVGSSLLSGLVRAYRRCALSSVEGTSAAIAAVKLATDDSMYVYFYSRRFIVTGGLKRYGKRPSAQLWTIVEAQCSRIRGKPLTVVVRMLAKLVIM